MENQIKLIVMGTALLERLNTTLVLDASNLLYRGNCFSHLQLHSRSFI